MFLSVRDRVRQIANGQVQPVPMPVSNEIAPPVVAPQPEPSKSKKTKDSASKTASEKTRSPPPSPLKSADPSIATAENLSPKAANSRAKSSKATPRRSANGKSDPSKAASSKPSSSKLSSPKSPSPKSSFLKSPSSKSSPLKSSSSKNSLPKAQSPKIAPSKPARSKSPRSKSTRSRSPPKAKIGSFTDEPTEPNAEVTKLKGACLKQLSGVTGLTSRRLAVVLKHRSSSGEWYAALKDVGSDKYLKMWTNRDKTFATQVEALQAYLIFVEKMKSEFRLFSMSPKASKSKP